MMATWRKDAPRTFADRLEQSRVDAGLTVETLAHEAHISPRHLDRIRAGDGKRGPAIDTVSNLATVLGVSPGWLAWGEGVK